VAYRPNVYEESKFVVFQCENVTWQDYNNKVKFLDPRWNLPIVYLYGNVKNNFTATFENVTGSS
jgi:hypothetical protein